MVDSRNSSLIGLKQLCVVTHDRESGQVVQQHGATQASPRVADQSDLTTELSKRLSPCVDMSQPANRKTKKVSNLNNGNVSPARADELFAIFAMRGRLDTRWFHSIQAQVNN